MASFSVKAIPQINIRDAIKQTELHNFNGTYIFCYDADGHCELPHVFKFSGGRSSGLLLFTLLESGILKAERGDVIIFNNTSAEHPKTYKFARQCKEIVERKYKIPFFWIEYQTYEDSRNARYTRIASYRLVNTEPYSETNPNGYRWRGEAYEEMLSWSGFVPNLYQRTCTVSLKLKCTRDFLKEWFANKPATERLGHFGKTSRLDDEELYERHLRSNGSVPKNIFLEKKKYVRKMPVSRPSQIWTDYSPVAKPFENPHLAEKTQGKRIFFGKEGCEYLSFVGLRYDEMRRVIKVRRRNSGGTESVGYEGEHVYMPLSDMKVTREDVEDFWNLQSWNLELDSKDNLSNCTYCFLKGLNGLQRAHASISSELDNSMKGTPCDINWWIDIEERYGRDMEAEEREIRKSVSNHFIGFFGANNGFSYRRLANASGQKELKCFADTVLPCDCTD